MTGSSNRAASTACQSGSDFRGSGGGSTGALAGCDAATGARWMIRTTRVVAGRDATVVAAGAGCTSPTRCLLLWYAVYNHPPPPPRIARSRKTVTRIADDDAVLRPGT